METLTLETFKSKIFDFEKEKEWTYRGELPAVIDFYADWCGPCRQLAPIIDELAQEYGGKIQFFKIDTDKSPELAALFGVRGIPALLFVPKDGEPAMNSGFVPKDGLQRAFQEIFNIPTP